MEFIRIVWAVVFGVLFIAIIGSGLSNNQYDYR